MLRRRLQEGVQVAHCEGDIGGRIKRLVMTARDLPIVEQLRKLCSVLIARAGVQRWVLGGVKHDRGHVDGRPASEEALIILIRFSAGRQPEAVPVGVDGDLDKVRVVERWRRPLEVRVEDRSRGRPLAPELSRQFPSIAAQARPPALAVEVVLVPVTALIPWERGLSGCGDVLDGVAPEGDDTPDTSGRRAAATQAARPPQSYPTRIGADSASVSTRFRTSRPIAACCPDRGVKSDTNRVAPKPRRYGASTHAPAVANSAATASNAYGSYGKPCRSRTGQSFSAPAVSMPTSNGPLRTNTGVKVTITRLGCTGAAAGRVGPGAVL